MTTGQKRAMLIKYWGYTRFQADLLPQSMLNELFKLEAA